MGPSQSSTLDTESGEGQAIMDKDTRDIVILRRLLETTGRWILFVHQGHIVKVARVAPEMPADVVLDDSTSKASPEPASCHAGTQ